MSARPPTSSLRRVTWDTAADAAPRGKAGPANADSWPYWEAASEGRLFLQQCAACRHVQFPPRHLCAACWESGLEWVESRGRGHVQSFTIVHRAPTPAFQDRVPYVVSVVRLEEGPWLVTNIVGDRALEVAIDDPVTVLFEPGKDGTSTPQFKLAPSGDA